MTIVASRPKQYNVVIPSAHAIGDVVHFSPTFSATGPAFDALVMGVTFTDYGKVLYDIALAEDPVGFYEAQPLRQVDSIFVQKRP